MGNKYKSKPIEVEAFVYGSNEASPIWFIKALRSKRIHVRPSVGHVVVLTPAGKINYYDPITFAALFESIEEAKDLNKDGKVDKREEALATETKKKRTKVKKKDKPVESE